MFKNNNNTITFYAPAFLEKSTKTGKSGKEVIYSVGGIISTEDKDTDGEIVKGLDVDTYFTGGWGKIKYEHAEYKEPDCFIGFPKKVIKKGKETHFIGELIGFDPEAKDEDLSIQQRLAKSTVNILQQIEEFNKRNPATPQKAGWSIEGKIIEKSKNLIKKAQVVNVVFTTKPVNTHTYAQLVKSLEVGYNIGGTDQTGFGATRVESIENDNKNRGKKMTKEKFYKSCIEKGMSKEEALKKTQQWEAENRDKIEEESTTAENNADKAAQIFGKSIQILGDIRDLDKYNPNIDDVEKNIEKSINTKYEEDIDITTYLNGIKELAKSAVVGSMLSNEKDEIIIKGQAVTSKGLEILSDVTASIVKQNAYLQNKIDSLQKSLDTTNFLLAKSGGILTTDIAKYSIQENDVYELKELSKSKKLEILSDGAIKGEIPITEVIKYENSNVLSKELENYLNKKLDNR